MRAQELTVHMSRHPGVIYTGQALADEMGIGDQTDRVTRALAYLATKNQVRRVGSGQYVWQGIPPEKEKTPGRTAGQLASKMPGADEVYEFAGILVRGTDGALYKLERLT